MSFKFIFRIFSFFMTTTESILYIVVFDNRNTHSAILGMIFQSVLNVSFVVLYFFVIWAIKLVVCVIKNLKCTYKNPAKIISYTEKYQKHKN